MNKNVLAIAIAAAVAAPSAFAAATVYGIAHMSVDAVQNAKNGASTTENGSVNSLSSNSSRLGVKGSEDLGAGMKAVYQFETTIAFDGDAKYSGFDGQRNSFVGLGGGFGTVLLGIHDTPYKTLARTYDLFDSRIGDTRTLTRPAGTATMGFDERPQNLVAYVSPSFNGIQATLAYVADEKNSKSTANDATAFSAGVGYRAGKLKADLAYETHAKGLNSTAANAKSMSGVRLGAAYDFGMVTLNGFYANQDVAVAADNVKARNIYGIGAGVKVGAAGVAKAQYYVSDKYNSADNGASFIAVGYDHNMSKNTTVYAAYALTDNANAASYQVNGGGGHGETTSVNAGKDPSAFSVGVIHKF
ncbi:MAG: porin [Thiotrichales bacterium]|nr:MAG: porin [Thiotrichales bacterium]